MRQRAPAARIVELCEGVPLVVRTVGMRLAARPAWLLHLFASRLSDESGRLDLLRFGHLDVRSSLMASYQQLTQGRRSVDGDAARAFRLLGILPTADFDTTTAVALADLTGERAEKALDRLVGVRLLESFRPGRYRIHNLFRLLAHELATVAEQEAGCQAALQRVRRARGQRPASSTRIG